MKKQVSKIKDSEKKATLEALFKTAERIKGENAATLFINEILTESEQITIGRRLLIANMILIGYKQSEIHNQLGVSPNTFSRIRQWLSGSFPDYDQALKQTVTKKEKVAYKRVVPFSFEHLKMKYPMHYLLFTLSQKAIRGLNK